MPRIKFVHTYEDIISIENLLLAWEEFVRGKKKRRDVQAFRFNLMSNVLTLHTELSEGTYRHGEYQAFKINDPKPRDIHKATVRDRLVHHALHRHLYPFFERTFCSDSYSSRKRKGIHLALNRFRTFTRRLQKKNTKTIWVLKCDIKKFFASIDHIILEKILDSRISDPRIKEILQNIIGSFSDPKIGKGLPLGNLTSQLLVNIYMNKFDQFVKHRLKVKYYIRYADDFVLLSHDKQELEEKLLQIGEFLSRKLSLELHPHKVSITTLASGVDFLGWVHFPNHRVLRTATKRRMFRTIQKKQGKEEVVQSYLGLLSHGNTHKLQQQVLDLQDDLQDLRKTQKSVH